MDEKERERRLNSFYVGLRAKKWAFMNGMTCAPPTDEECEPPAELLPSNKTVEGVVDSLPIHPNQAKEG